jgi:hypothetical protein
MKVELALAGHVQRGHHCPNHSRAGRAGVVRRSVWEICRINQGCKCCQGHVCFKIKHIEVYASRAYLFFGGCYSFFDLSWNWL